MSEINKDDLINDCIQATTGIYPARIVSSKTGETITERTEWQEGWNSYVVKNYGVPANNVSEEWKKGYDAAELNSKTQYEKLSIWYDNLGEYQAQIATLLDNDDLFVKYHEETDQVILTINCNDLFYWACADEEDITLDEIPELLKEIQLDETYGLIKWCCKKRGLQPQSPIRQRIKEAKLWNDDLEKLTTPESF